MTKFKMILKVYAFILIICSIYTQQQEPDPQEPEYGLEIQQELKSEKDMIFFSIKTESLNKINDKDSDVIITAAGLNPQSDPDIFISKTNKFPKYQEPNERKPCTSFGTDICVITNEEIISNKQFYVGIKCQLYPCSIVFSVTLQDEYHLKLNESRMIYFDDRRLEAQVIFDVLIPSDMFFESILFDATLLNAYSVTQPIIMNVGKNNPGTDGFEYQVKDSWGDSKILKLSKSQVGDTKKFKVLIEGGKSAIVMFSVIPLQSNEMVQLKTYYEEYLSDDVQTNYYKLVVKQELVSNKYDLDFFITPYSGQPKLYIHCGPKRPDTLLSYKWHNMDESRGSGSRIIQPEQRFACSTSGEETYYLAVNSDFSSTYSLYIYPVNNSYLYLDLNRNILGVLYKEKIHNYNIIIYENPANFNISLIFHNFNTNNYFWAFTKQCNSTKLICEIPFNAIEQKLNYTNNMNTDIFASKIIGSNLNIVLRPNSEQCQFKYNIWTCRFSITLYLESTQPQESLEYEITALHANAFATLKEGYPVHQYVETDFYRQFYINIQKSAGERIKSITFSLTSISGSQRFFVDKKKYDSNNQTDLESKFLYESYFVYNQIQILEDKVWEGPYYIYVKGYNSGFFTFKYTVTMQKESTGQTKTSYVQLKKDLVLDQYLIGNTSFYFQTTIKQVEDHYIKIQPYYGIYRIYIALNNTQPPSQSYHTWGNQHIQSFGSGRRTIALISPKSPYFPSLNSIIYGVVEIDNENFSDLAQDPHFSIVLHTSSSIYELIEGKNFNNKISAQETQSLKFEPQSDSDFLISFDAPTKEKYKIKIYYEIGIRQRFPSELSQDGYITGDKKILKILKSQFAQCKLRVHHDDQSCSVFMSVESKVNTSYSIIITKDQQNITALELIEGESLTLPLYKVGESRNFYYQIHPNYGLDIYQYSVYNNLRLYGSIVKLNKSTDQYQYPNSTVNNFVLDSSSFYLNETYIKNQYCQGQCILLMTIEPIYDYVIGNDTFTIKVIQNSLYQIDEGIPYYGFVKKNDINYYFFNFMTPLETIFISLHGIGSSSDPDLYVAYNRFPSRYDYDYQSSNKKGDYIAINNETRTGQFVIGVFGFNSSKYALQYQIGNFIFLNLYANEQFYVDLNKNQTAYFIYYHYSQQGFSVQSFINQGQASMGIKVIQDDNNNNTDSEISAFKCSDGDWNTNAQDSQDRKLDIKSKDIKFCTSCQYMIAVCSSYGANLNLMVNIEGEFIMLRTDTVLKNQLAKNQKQYYNIYLYNQQKIELQVTSHIGSVNVYINNSNNVSDVRGGYQDMNQVSSNQVDIVQFYLEPKKSKNDYDFYDWYSFSVLVVGTLNKNIYSILASEYQQKTLSFGVPITVEFLPQKFHQFQFHFDKEKGSQYTIPQFSIYLTSKSGKVNFGTLTKEDLINIQITYSRGNKTQLDNDEQENSKTQFNDNENPYQDKSSSSQYYIYSLINKPSGHFIFKIKNIYHLAYRGVVVVENGGMISMVQDQIYTQISHKNEHFQYEYYVQSKSQLLIELNQCVGRSSIKAYKNYNKLLNDEDEIPMHKLGPQQGYNILPIESDSMSIIYFKVHAYIHDGDLNQYTLNIKPFPLKHKFPQDYMSPGNSGKMRFRWKEKGKLHVRLSKVQCEENTCPEIQYNRTSIQYILYIGKDYKPIQRDVYCKSQQNGKTLMIFAKDVQNFETHQEYIEHPFSEWTHYIDYYIDTKDLQELQNIEYLYFMVKAIVKIQDEKAQYYETNLYYNPQELLMTDMTFTEFKEIDPEIIYIDQGISGVWIGLAIMVILILAALLFLIFQRYRNAQKQLDYERADPRNMARDIHTVELEGSYKEQQTFKIMTDEKMY